ncbi:MULTISPECIES: hypothetical protein [Vagococcus]|uniref:hypothetical protein n=1 Tax=Vagococcus TaxID=2737 RepID=UPI000E4D52C2|nr:MULTISPECIES: hypothetical protein [Vagococcus]RHH67509.1 hypothetical protein DW196_09325 [Vagococcus sp. AM17-17]
MTDKPYERKKNIYIKEETQKMIEDIMEKENIATHTEAVRKIIHDYYNEKLKQETELKIKLNSIDKEVNVLSHLMVFMAESMSATKHDKRLSRLYEEAVEEREKDIKRKQNGLMFNE